MYKSAISFSIGILHTYCPAFFMLLMSFSKQCKQLQLQYNFTVKNSK